MELRNELKMRILYKYSAIASWTLFAIKFCCLDECLLSTLGTHTMSKSRVDFDLRSASQTDVGHIVTDAQPKSLVGMVRVLFLVILVNVIGVAIGPGDDFERTGRAKELGSY